MVLNIRKLASKAPAVICALALGFTACSKEDLQKLQKVVVTPPVNSAVNVNFCTDPAQVVKSKLKYVFIMDHSGSNQVNYQCDPNTGMPQLDNTGALIFGPQLGTDPQRNSRYGNVGTAGTLLDFLHNTPANDPNDPSVFFSMYYFSSSYTPYPANGGFTSDVRAFENQVAYIKANTTDNGWTNYVDTLQAVQTLIYSDITAADKCAKMSVTATPTASCPHPGTIVSSSYVLVFMSDGAPVMNLTLSPLVMTKQPTSEVLGTVAGIVGLQTSYPRYVDGINLFTIYYYQPTNPDNTAKTLLQQMASVGNGIFYNITSGSNVDYRQFTPPTRLLKYTLADVFVTNASVVVGSDGKAHADADMDGIADDQEWQSAQSPGIGSDPAKLDSDGNGVSDLVEYIANGSPCGYKDSTGKCAKGSGTINYFVSSLPNGSQGCNINGISRQIVNGSVVYSSSDPDGLNDCEKVVLSDAGGVDNPDSNGDIIPDWLEFKNGVGFQLGTPPALGMVDADGVSFYDKIKASLPVQTPYYQILSPQPAQYDLTLLGTTPYQDCYNLVVNHLPMAGPNNTVRLDVILRTSLLQDRYLYRTSTQQFAGTSQSITFFDWNSRGQIGSTTTSSSGNAVTITLTKPAQAIQFVPGMVLTASTTDGGSPSADTVTITSVNPNTGVLTGTSSTSSSAGLSPAWAANSYLVAGSWKRWP